MGFNDVYLPSDVVVVGEVWVDVWVFRANKRTEGCRGGARGGHGPYWPAGGPIERMELAVDRGDEDYVEELEVIVGRECAAVPDDVGGELLSGTGAKGENFSET